VSGSSAWVLVVAGSAVGGMLRYAVALAGGTSLPRSFPWSTLGVNVLGSLAIGALYVICVTRGVGADWSRPLLLVGLLGGFTTFSAFSLETVLLIEQGALLRATAYAVASVVLCVGGAWLGMALAR